MGVAAPVFETKILRCLKLQYDYYIRPVSDEDEEMLNEHLIRDSTPRSINRTLKYPLSQLNTCEQIIIITYYSSKSRIISIIVNP